MKWLNGSIGPINRALTITNTLGVRESKSNCNEGVHHIPQSFTTGASPSGCLISYPGRGSLTPFQRCSRASCNHVQKCVLLNWIVTCNNTVVYTSLVFYRNTWKPTQLCMQLFVLERNIWYYVTMCKQII